MTEENNKENSVERSKKYLSYLFIGLIFVQIIDVYTTDVISFIPSILIQEFLPGYSTEQGVSIFAACLSIATLGALLAIISRYLADRIGRKNLLIITVSGIAICPIFLILATDIIQLTIIMFIARFFFIADIWAFYIAEESPTDKRSLWIFVIIAFGPIGGLFIPLSRSIFITDTFSNWRGMYLISIILGILMVIIIFFTFKETSVYEIMKSEKSLKEEKMKSTLRKNLKILFETSHRKQYSILLIGAFFIGLNFAVIGFFEPLISFSGNYTQADFNTMLFIAKLATLIGYLFTGTLSEKLGRKPVICIYVVLWTVSVIAVVIGSNMTEGGFVLVSIGASFASIATAGCNVLTYLIIYEIIPTEARATSSGVKLAVGTLGTSMGLLIISLLTVPLSAGGALITLALIFLINLPLFYFALKETKGVDLTKIH